MKKSVWFVLLIGIGLVVLLLFECFQHKETAKPTIAAIINRKANVPPVKQIHGSKPASALTPEEKSTLEQLFNAKFKPAIDKWANAYSNRIPFDVSEITVDKFHSTLAGGFYTFMIGSTTFTIFNGVNETKVFYMMTKQGARDLNSIPTDGKSRDLSLPITREEVLPMAEADTGLHYELKDIVIKPTGTYCVIDGGADVEVGIKYENGMMLIDRDNLGFVIGKDGKLVMYQH